MRGSPITHDPLPSPSPLARVEGANIFSFSLQETNGRLELRALHHPGYGAICADWCTPDLRRRIASGRKHLLARAVGLNKQRDLRILDATAGLGRDGFTLAALGARVTLTERNATIAALLRDAQRRALADTESAAPSASAGDNRSFSITPAAEAAARIDIVESDARELLGHAQEQQYDVIYLDPMYPDINKTALAKKELQLLRELTGGDPDADALLSPARSQARLRVTVKRPVKAPWLADAEPQYSLKGSQARFDIYLPTRA